MDREIEMRHYQFRNLQDAQQHDRMIDDRDATIRQQADELDAGTRVYAAALERISEKNAIITSQAEEIERLRALVESAYREGWDDAIDGVDTYNYGKSRRGWLASDAHKETTNDTNLRNEPVNGEEET